MPTFKLTRLALATLLAATSAAAMAQDQIEVLHWWTTGGTAATAAKLKEAAAAKGVGWKDVAVAGNENQRTSLKTRVMKGPCCARCSTPQWRRPNPRCACRRTCRRGPRGGPSSSAPARHRQPWPARSKTIGTGRSKAPW